MKFLLLFCELHTITNALTRHLLCNRSGGRVLVYFKFLEKVIGVAGALDEIFFGQKEIVKYLENGKVWGNGSGLIGFLGEFATKWGIVNFLTHSQILTSRATVLSNRTV